MALEETEKEKNEKNKIINEQEEKINNLITTYNVKEEYNILLKDKAVSDTENQQLKIDINTNKLLVEEISKKFEDNKLLLSNNQN